MRWLVLEGVRGWDTANKVLEGVRGWDSANKVLEGVRGQDTVIKVRFLITQLQMDYLESNVKKGDTQKKRRMRIGQQRKEICE